MRLGRAYVVLPGGTGTLLELALVWELLGKRMLRRRAPIILLGDHWTPVVQSVKKAQPDAHEPQVAPNVELAMQILKRHLADNTDEEGGQG